MSSRMTEIPVMPLSPKFKAEPEAWEAFLKENVRSEIGIKSMSYGVTMEDENLAIAFVEWESMEIHQAFLAGPLHPVFRAGFASFLSGRPEVAHVALKPPSAGIAAQGPVVQYGIFHFKPDEDPADILTALKTAYEAATAYSECLGGAYGISEDNAQQAFVILNWPTKEAHVQGFRHSPGFKVVAEVLLARATDFKAYHIPVKHMNVE